MSCLNKFYFFQAEDGIRDLTVTGVQTCALPISTPRPLPTRARSSTMMAPAPAVTAARARSNGVPESGASASGAPSRRSSEMVQIEPPGLRPDDQVPLFGIRLIYKDRAQALLSLADLKSIAAVQGPMSSDICVVNKPRHGSELHVREKWAHHIPPQRDFANYLRENSGVKDYRPSSAAY